MRVHINYKVADDKVEENKAAVQAFVAKVREANDPTHRFEAFQSVKDPTRFTHVAFLDDEDARTRFHEPEYFKTFLAGLEARCVDGLDVTDLDLLASSALED